MKPQELEVLIAQTMQAIYRASYDNKLTDAEYDYFIHSILCNIAIGLSNSAHKTMKKNYLAVEPLEEKPQSKCDYSGPVLC